MSRFQTATTASSKRIWSVSRDPGPISRLERKEYALKRELIVQLHASFEQLTHVAEDAGVEFWLARDLQEILGYQTWQSFEQVIQKAVPLVRKLVTNRAIILPKSAK